MQWTDHQLDQVRNMRAEGLSYTQIATRFGISKSAAVSAGRRAGVPASKPAVHKRPQELTDAIHRAMLAGATNQDLRSQFPSVRRFDHIRAELRGVLPSIPRTHAVARSKVPSERFDKVESRKALMLDDLPGRNECCRPFGEPGRSSFRFCGAPTKPGRPYCRSCESVVYQPARKATGLQDGGAYGV